MTRRGGGSRAGGPAASSVRCSSRVAGGAPGLGTRARRWTRVSLLPIIAVMDVRAQWYDVISTRISRRRFDGRPVPAELREQLEVFCDGASAPAGAPDSPAVEPGAVTAPARVCLVDDPRQQLFTGLIGGYGKVAGTPLSAAFIGRAPSGDGDVPDDVQAAVGYLGEGLILEATRLGLGTCWIAGTFDHAGAADLVELAPGEQVVAVTPLGYPTTQQAERRAPAAHDGQGVGAPQRREDRAGHPRRRLAAVGGLGRAGREAGAVRREPPAVALPPGRRLAGAGARGEALLDRAHRSSASRACTSSWARSTRA